MDITFLDGGLGLMIGYIKGVLAETEESYILVENHGIGYKIFVPATVFSGGLAIGEEIKVYTYLSVKEDAIQLYGFLTRDDLEMYKMLLSVNGIGPKAGIGVLSALSADELRMAVLSDDIKTISKAPGIGKKTAQKLILELKDKMKLEDVLGHVSAEGTEMPVSGAEDSVKEAVQALAALGYASSEALKAVRRVEGAASMEVEELLKAALKYMI